MNNICLMIPYTLYSVQGVQEKTEQTERALTFFHNLHCTNAFSILYASYCILTFELHISFLVRRKVSLRYPIQELSVKKRIDLQTDPFPNGRIAGLLQCSVQDFLDRSSSMNH